MAPFIATESIMGAAGSYEQLLHQELPYDPALHAVLLRMLRLSPAPPPRPIFPPESSRSLAPDTRAPALHSSGTWPVFSFRFRASLEAHCQV